MAEKEANISIDVSARSSDVNIPSESHSASLSLPSVPSITSNVDYALTAQMGLSFFGDEDIYYAGGRSYDIHVSAGDVSVNSTVSTTSSSSVNIDIDLSEKTSEVSIDPL